MHNNPSVEIENGISVLVRTSNSEKSLRALIGRLKLGSQDELIVVDTASEDGTVELAKQAGAKVVHNAKPFNYSRALNLGFENARCPWVLALSVHCLPVKDAFLECYREAIGRLTMTPSVLYGGQVLSRTQYARANKEPRSYAGLEALSEIRGGGNANALYSRSAWKLHPFDENLVTGEDLEWLKWAARSGLVCAVALGACVLYRHPGGFGYRFSKAVGEIRAAGSGRPMSLVQLVIGIAHATRHLLWEEFVPRTWLGQVAHQLGSFVASRSHRKVEKSD